MASLCVGRGPVEGKAKISGIVSSIYKDTNLITRPYLNDFTNLINFEIILSPDKVILDFRL